MFIILALLFCVCESAFRDISPVFDEQLRETYAEIPPVRFDDLSYIYREWKEDKQAYTVKAALVANDGILTFNHVERKGKATIWGNSTLATLEARFLVDLTVKYETFVGIDLNSKTGISGNMTVHNKGIEMFTWVEITKIGKHCTPDVTSFNPVTIPRGNADFGDSSSEFLDRMFKWAAPSMENHLNRTLTEAAIPYFSFVVFDTNWCEYLPSDN